MKLINKKTGEIVYATMMASYCGGELQIRYYPVNNAESTHSKVYRSISELNEEWEDYEEPKSTIKDVWFNSTLANGHFVEIDFISDEEAEKAVEKLKAWKRLKDKGFKFDGYDVAHNNNGDLCGQLFYNAGDYCIEDVEKDLDLLFGGEDA